LKIDFSKNFSLFTLCESFGEKHQTRRRWREKKATRTNRSQHPNRKER
jgi:hypothetical protein